MRTVPALDLVGAATPEEWDLVAAALDDYPLLAVHETGTEEAPRWRVFFRAATDRDAAAALLASSFPTLSLTPVLVEDENWAARSQAALRAIQVGRLVVAPPWDVPHVGPMSPGAHAPDDPLARTPADASQVIVIQPSTGFGTGHHETTRLCLGLLQEEDVRGRRVLDVGTGSGVLAIAAAVLGASKVIGIDTDPDALENAQENAALNGFALDAAGAPVLTFAAADVRDEQVAADIVLANLTGALLASSAAHLAERVRPGGVLIASGFLHHEAEAVIAALEAASLRLASHRCEGEWEGITLRRS